MNTSQRKKRKKQEKRRKGKSQARTASGEPSKGLVSDRKPNVEAEPDALMPIKQSQTPPEREVDRNISQPDTPIQDTDRPNGNQPITNIITINAEQFVNGTVVRPDDGNTPLVSRGIRLQHWLWLIVFGIMLMGGFASEDARVALKKLLDDVVEVIEALNRFRP